MNILYVGPLFYGSTSLQRLKALEHLGHQVIGIDSQPPAVARRQRRFGQRLWAKMVGPRDLAQANDELLRLVKIKPPDILWVDKGLTIRPETLEAARDLHPHLVRVSFSPDDMLNPKNQSRHYLAAIPRYDLHVTTKSYNVAELKALGAPRVLFMDNAYCPFTHRPWVLSAAEREHLGGPVGFIGAYEAERAATLRFLAEEGVAVKIWGDWPRRWQNRHPNLRVMGRSLWGDDYAKGVSAFDINLAFLRKENRDRQTTRSVEIPACGGFMLAERTDEHERLFREDQEAAYFSTPEELRAKIAYYLEAVAARERLRQAGRERCRLSRYSYPERLAEVLGFIQTQFTRCEL